MLDSSNTNKIDLWFARYRICYYFSSDRDFKEKWLIFKIGVFLWVKTLLELSICYLYIFFFSNVIMRNFGHYWKSWPWYKNLFYISFVLFVRLYGYTLYILFIFYFFIVFHKFQVETWEFLLQLIDFNDFAGEFYCCVFFVCFSYIKYQF